MYSYLFTRFAALGLLASSAFLASCGGGNSVVSPFAPTRVVVFGDAFSLTAAAGKNAYTVNDGSANIWASQVAAGYGISTIVNNAQANATVDQIAVQVSAFGASYQAGDLVLVSGGFRDLVNLGVASGSTADAAAAKGAALAAVVGNIVAAGAAHVLVVNAYDLANTPASIAGLMPSIPARTACSSGRSTLIQSFNDKLKINLTTPVNLGNSVRLVDAESYINLVSCSPTTYSFVDATTVVCTNKSTGLGFGATAQVDASLCAPANATGGTATTYTTPAYNNYVFADVIYPTPALHRLLGSYAYQQAVARW